jgi:hypothetical protein
MKSDTDTKFILTIIAVCLIWIAAGGPSLIPGVQAQGAYCPRHPERFAISGSA